MRPLLREVIRDTIALFILLLLLFVVMLAGTPSIALGQEFDYDVSRDDITNTYITLDTLYRTIILSPLSSYRSKIRAYEALAQFEDIHNGNIDLCYWPSLRRAIRVTYRGLDKSQNDRPFWETTAEILTDLTERQCDDVKSEIK